MVGKTTVSSTGTSSSCSTGFPFDTYLRCVSSLAGASRPVRGYSGVAPVLSRSSLLLLALTALLVAAPVAQASDKSVFRAWTSENRTLGKLESTLAKNLKSWTDSGGRRGTPALERIAKIRTLVARRKAAVNDEEAATAKGASGRKNALASLRDYDAAMVRLRNALNAGMDGRSSTANSYLKQYDSLIARSGKYEDRALAAFKEAGVP